MCDDPNSLSKELGFDSYDQAKQNAKCYKLSVMIADYYSENFNYHPISLDFVEHLLHIIDRIMEKDWPNTDKYVIRKKIMEYTFAITLNRYSCNSKTDRFFNNVFLKNHSK